MLKFQIAKFVDYIHTKVDPHFNVSQKITNLLNADRQKEKEKEKEEKEEKEKKEKKKEIKEENDEQND